MGRRGVPSSTEQLRLLILRTFLLRKRSVMAAFLELLDRPTPLLSLGSTRLKLELLRPSGGADDRALGIWEGAPPEAFVSATGGAALAAAAWARARGVKLRVLLRGAVTHEVREALRIWGVQQGRAGKELVPLDGDQAVREVQRTLGAELLRELEGRELQLIVAPAGARAALLGVFAALRVRYPQLRAQGLIAADEELPELPREASLPGVDLIRITRAESAQARAAMALEQGLLASHASAAAVVVARRSGLSALALLTSAGEREFSLDAAPAQAPLSAPPSR